MSEINWGLLQTPQALDPVSALHLGAADDAQRQSNYIAQQKLYAAQQAQAAAIAARQQAAALWQGGNTRGAQAALIGAGDNDTITSLNASEKQDVDQDRQGTMELAGVAKAIQSLPYDQRKPALTAIGPHLIANHDISQAELDAFDPTDDNLRAYTGYGYTPEKQDDAARANLQTQINQQNADTQRSTELRLQNTPVFGAPGDTPFIPGGATAGSAAGGGAPVNGGHLDPAQFFKDFVAPHEGGYAAHDANGAPVNFGINQSANPGVDVKNLTADAASQIFANKYFAQSGAGNLPPALAAVHADTAFINPARAQQFLAQSGGDSTRYMQLRQAWMDHLVQSDPAKYGQYAKAWGTRNADLSAYAARLGNGQPAPTNGVSGPTQLPTLAPKADPNAVDPTDPGVELAAKIYAATGEMTGLGMGNGPMRRAVLNRAAQIVQENHWTPAQIASNKADYKGSTAALQKDQKQVDTIVGAEETAKANGQRMVDLSKYAPGSTGSTDYNAARNWLGRRFGDSRVSDMDAAHLTFTNEQARVLSSSPNGSGQLTDSARHEAMETINGNASPEQKQSALNVLVADMEARKAAIQNRIDARTAHIQHLGDPSPAAASGPIRVSNAAQYHSLPSGTVYLDPQGQQRRKP